MTIRLSNAQSRALEKLDRREERSAQEIGESVVTCNDLVVAGYAARSPLGYRKVKDVD